ncbi:MAG: DUF4358 domain-containing protein [Clostridia bacterium]|nr:DUF4358 domain-containing protein [Clostridia bacterium]
MKKITILLAVLILLSFASCGKSVEKVSAPQTAQAWLDLLSGSLPFDDMMTQIPDRAPSLYGIADEDGYTGDSALYISTNATPEEIAVFQIDAAFSAEALTELAEARLARQKESFAGYAPQETPKLDSAVVRVCGDFVIVCVCADNAKAETLLSVYA